MRCWAATTNAVAAAAAYCSTCYVVASCGTACGTAYASTDHGHTKDVYPVNLGGTI